jgi:hypothetical protein
VGAREVGRPEARARALLIEHLTPEQRREYEETGTFRVVKNGVVWAWCVWRVLLVHAALLALIAVPAYRIGGASAAAGILLASSVVLLPRWVRALRVAFSRRRTWCIEPFAAPALHLRRSRIEFCVHVAGVLPGADRMLAYKNILDSNEPHFLSEANAHI